MRCARTPCKHSRHTHGVSRYTYSEYIESCTLARAGAQVDFLLTQRSLRSLALITSEEGWKKLIRENEAEKLHSPELLYSAVDWMQNDRTAEW